MNASLLRNMTLDELTGFVERAESVPSTVVREIMACLQDEIDSADSARMRSRRDSMTTISPSGNECTTT